MLLKKIFIAITLSLLSTQAFALSFAGPCPKGDGYQACIEERERITQKWLEMNNQLNNPTTTSNPVSEPLALLSIMAAGGLFFVRRKYKK